MAPTQHTANETQIGGDHYKGMILEHWDITALLGLDYFQGQITRYVMRWRDKGGIQDLEKARHVLDKYIELEKLLRDGKPAMVRALLMQSLAKLDKAQRGDDEVAAELAAQIRELDEALPEAGLAARLAVRGFGATGLEASDSGEGGARAAAG